MNKNILKIAGLVCSVVGFGLQIAQDKIADHKLRDTIAKEVAKQIANKK